MEKTSQQCGTEEHKKIVEERAARVVDVMRKRYPGTFSAPRAFFSERYTVPKPLRTGLPYGKNRGYQTVPLGRPVRDPVYTEKQKHLFLLVKDIGREITGFSPYEKRAMNQGSMRGTEEAVRFLTKRLGSSKRAKAKYKELAEEMQKV